jgi:Histidine kinase-, DNA gyrase B-, and HSP90-like ATPase
MPTSFAKATPRKSFFIEMFTRDITLEACILDLIDNSIDALIRRDHIDTRKILDLNVAHKKPRTRSLPNISVRFDNKAFTIQDNCGGISVKDAQDDAFNFGHAADHSAAKTGRQLGAYGIGLKRALFKIGRHFEIDSKTATEGFSMDVDLKAWASDDREESWRFPMTLTRGAASVEKAGTTIRVNAFERDIKLAFEDETLTARLHRQIAQTYGLFLDKYVTVKINGTKVEPAPIPIGVSRNIDLAIESFKYDGVAIKILAGFAARDDSKRWSTDAAGWYILCNGRVIVSADKTELTGWTGKILPVFQPKFRGFVGIALFHSVDPLKLPWTTTKRSLNRDSAIYHSVRDKMVAVARPILRQLEAFYGPEKDESLEERAAAEATTQADLAEVAVKSTSTFRIKAGKTPRKKTEEQINFKVRVSELNRVRKHLRNPSMSKSDIGRLAFEYYMRSEGLK